MATRYVWKAASGSNNGGATGATEDDKWNNAWTELSSVTWSGMAAGDTLWVGGGTYTTSWLWTAASRVGTLGSPLIVSLSDEAGHNGDVIIDGGRTPTSTTAGQGGAQVSKPLPYYGSSGYGATNHSALVNGIDFGNSSTNYAAYVVLDGKSIGRLIIRGVSNTGIQFGWPSHHITVKFAVAYDCGDWALNSSPAVYSTTGTAPVEICGANIAFEDCLFFDGAEDAFNQRSQGSSMGGYCNTISHVRCWMFNSRTKPDGTPWNDGDISGIPARHADGSQYYSDKRTDDGFGARTGTLSGFSYMNCVFGPNLRAGGQMGDSAGDGPVGLANVLMQDVLAYGNAEYGIQALPGLASRHHDWTLTRVTVHTIGATAGPFEFTTTMTNFAMSDCVLVGDAGLNQSLIVPTDGTYTSIWRFRVPGGNLTQIPTTADPVFKDRTVYGKRWLDADFALAGTGAPTTSGSQVTSPLDIVGRASVEFWITVPLRTVNGLVQVDFKERIKPTNYVVAVRSSTEALVLIRRPKIFRLLLTTQDGVTAEHGLNTSAIDAALNTEAQRIAGVNVTRSAYALAA